MTNLLCRDRFVQVVLCNYMLQFPNPELRLPRGMGRTRSRQQGGLHTQIGGGRGINLDGRAIASAGRVPD